MVRKAAVTNRDGDGDRYINVVTGGPTKYYNRRRVKKASLQKQALPKFEPISAEWFKTIVAEISLARRRKRLSQLSLAGILGTSQAEISRIEQGKTNPTVDLLDRLFSALDLKIKITFKQR